ncbi:MULTISPECIES: thioredoxin domain-containing protein [Cyanophyceae]|uniref:DsbA family protein n=1 Tax=Cyanophyceae TaxID=3028117 RepID=UPI001689CD5D|nr:MULTISPECIES: thioredoxin domain-containing protein [Cyanophyceae]MBD1914944.1 thioredoxin domain-containing protein [Phormidium sp. FACHB-77]MBD2028622.1 thioredoxin domain-containing protein [Phormidium sp. FACHB-322]MBD2051734.1 thioredoxin domain-containing protein [Leptolyngbya sp. FACHB-60]
MDQFLARLRESKLLRWGIVAALLVGTAVPLLIFLPRRNQASPPPNPKAHQEIVTEVITSSNRASLIGSSPTKGNPNAPIVLFKFSDFQCPYCVVAAGNMNEFVGQHEDEILYVYKHFPLTQIHPEAMPSAKAAWAAGQQGQFWLYHDGLFVNQNRLGEDLYVELAEAMQLNVEQFNRDRTSAEAEAAIEQDLALAEQLQLRGTPSFIMNDLLIPGGAPLQLFEQIFDQINAAIQSQNRP